MTQINDTIEQNAQPSEAFDWENIARYVLLSRALDNLEENTLVPEKKVLYQFSARGHDMAQVMLGLQLDNIKDGICGYYRSRPLLLTLGVEVEHALSSTMARSGGYTDGRDIGILANYPNATGPSVLPMCGGVGTQYTPAAGWAQAVDYSHKVLKDSAYEDAISIVLGGDGSVASNGFWSALTLATTQQLPMLFYIEDNGYGISVPSTFQTPGGNIAKNLKSWTGLKVFDGDGTLPETAADLTAKAVAYVRKKRAPALLRLTIPRLQGHSYQDTQKYKTDSVMKSEWQRDPLPRLRSHLVPAYMSAEAWADLEEDAFSTVEDARALVEAKSPPAAESAEDHIFSTPGIIQKMGGLWANGYTPPASTTTPQRDGARINMVTAIRKVLDHEMTINPKVVMFGEDVGPKGGVHAVTLGLQEKHGDDRVFDTSLSEEGIIGRAVGMSLAGLMPVPEIQFRKYLEPAIEQINDCGTMRWRTNNQFAAPMVVRIPGGFFKFGDPWHSQTNEVAFVHQPGWKVAVPSNAEDAVGLLRTSLRGNDPVIFFEHRAMLDHSSARRPYPGDDYVLPFGNARITQKGEELTIVTWGAMVNQCELAAKGYSVEVIDLRTLMPWDKTTVLESIARTHRCLIVHEDILVGGFGAEIAAVIADEAFEHLDAPVSRIAMPSIPCPYSTVLLEAAVPSVDKIANKIDELVNF